MQTLELDQISAVWGGEDPGPASDETTGYCGPGKFSLGGTPECKAHDDCVGKAAQTFGRPIADAICAPLLPAAIASAAKCAVDPYCPK